MAKKGPTRSGTPLKKISEEKINFQSVFTNFCSQVTEKTPIVRVLTQPLKPGQEWKTYPASITKIKDYFEVFIQNENCEKSGMVHKVLVRNEDLDYRILDALNNTINQYDTVTVLRLNNCNLLHEELNSLHRILKEYPTITELNIDENPNKRQNFNILLKENKLQYLSMQKCKINERGLKYISNEIKEHVKNLVSLDLSSNLIDDEGIVHLSNALKTNRTIVSLILADNWLTNKGLETLMRIFRDFELTHDEIEIRRKLNFEYEFKKLQLKENFIELGASFSKRKVKSSNTVAIRKSLKASSKTSRGTKSSAGSKTTSDNRLELFLAKNLKKSDHPFVNECIAENGSIYCLGNLKVTYLNISYNRITDEGLSSIIETLQHQISLPCIRENGLTNIVLSGNNINDLSMLCDIKTLLKEKLFTSLSRLEKGRRKSSKLKNQLA